MTDTKKIFIGVAWPYVNGDIHVGHLAGYLVPCDIFARFSRLSGRETLMVSGTDCHGTPITIAADKKGVSPQDIINEYDPRVRELISLYNVSYDLFTSTVTQNHKEVTQEVFLNLLKNGFILKKTSDQYYSEEEKKFLPDRYVEGECPHCHAKEQRSDQCENCGRTLGLGELINPISKLTSSSVTLKETEHYFIDLPKLQSELKDYVDKSMGWRTWVKNETLGWLTEGLEQRAITRDIDWGVEIPIDRIPNESLINGVETKKFYVWFDAVIGYLSAAVEWSKANNRNVDDFWKNPECLHYYFMGKDNLTFHTIFWPGQIIGQRQNYNLPYFPSVNQNLNLEGQRFSKSRGVHIDAKEVGKYFGVDNVRFYIASIMPESKDSNWKWSEFRETVNSGLNGNIGNFINRTLVFFNNKLELKISVNNTVLDDELKQQTEETFKEVSAFLEKCEFVNALNRILKYSQFGNQYFDKQKPWVSIKEDKAVSEKTIYNCLQVVYSLKTLLTPFVPNAMKELDELLGLNEFNTEVGVNKYNFVKLDVSKLKIEKVIKPLFKKVEETDTETFIAQ